MFLRNLVKRNRQRRKAVIRKSTCGWRHFCNKDWLSDLLLKAVHPFALEKVHEEHDGAEGPGEG